MDPKSLKSSKKDIEKISKSEIKTAFKKKYREDSDDITAQSHQSPLLETIHDRMVQSQCFNFTGCVDRSQMVSRTTPLAAGGNRV